MLMKSLAFTLFAVLIAAPAQADFAEDLAAAAEERATHRVFYDPSYVSLDYPMGDVPAHTGVCTDVVIRSYRVLGVDLQQEVHEDMKAHFSRYPKIWGLKRPDPNIDHRRVPNLETFLQRKGAALPISSDPKAYKPGDVVTWRLPDNRPHMGIVTSRKSSEGVPLIAHNIGAGPQVEDMLFDLEIHGHFRWGGR
ncbi:MAG: DUF1287 domain-containing protein [Rhodobacteraceae bacterium]|nr:DUF1287 domain-containing protein [Paracoccaceae bacterium]